jgi:septal ring factor EnvC (AmiA/AmiB activator)
MSKDKIKKLEFDIQSNEKIMHKLNSKLKSLEFTNQKKRKELAQIKNNNRKSVL